MLDNIPKREAFKNNTRKRKTSYITIESSGGNDEISTKTHTISDAIINGIMHASRDTIDNSDSGTTISHRRAHMPNHGPHDFTSIRSMIYGRRRVQYENMRKMI